MDSDSECKAVPLSNFNEFLPGTGKIIQKYTLLIQKRTYKKAPYIIAIDFDDTICAYGWPDIRNGVLIESTVQKMYTKLEENPDTEFILWTARTGSLLDDAMTFIFAHGLPIYLANTNHPAILSELEPLTAYSPKIWANEYWDDKAVPINGIASIKSSLGGIKN